jgi:hypothetical protein
MFEMYGGPWSASVSDKTPARLLWQGRKTGAVLKLAAIPVEAVFVRAHRFARD